MDDGWADLGQRILAERSRRWRTRIDFVHATGLSRRVLSDLERGARSNYQASTLAAVEATSMLVQFAEQALRERD